MGCRLQAAKIQDAGGGLWDADHGLWAAGHELRAACHGLRATCLEFNGLWAGCGLRAMLYVNNIKGKKCKVKSDNSTIDIYLLLVL